MAQAEANVGGVAARPSWRWAAVGALLGEGAPLGLLALRRLRAARAPGRPWRAWLRRELTSEPWLYAYLAATSATAFAIFGWALGRLASRERAIAAALGRAREEHAAVVAHDLRSPIQSILLESELLARHVEDPAALARGLGRIERGAERLGEMVRHLADATQLELGRVRLDRRPTPLADATAALIERLRPTLAGRSTELHVDGEAPPVLVDVTRLDEILTNLLDNAAKYSAPGAPIRVEVAPAAGGAIVSVVDRGPGIPDEELPRLFERYYQAARARAKKSGLGLGLYITRGLVEAHGGRIDVTSRVGEGSRFTVWLPAA